MDISLEGGKRAGKTLLGLYLASIGHLYGLKVKHNLIAPPGQQAVRFPAEAFGTWNPDYETLIKPFYPRGVAPAFVPLDRIVAKDGSLLWHEKGCFFYRQEFYKEVESRSMGNQDFRFGVLDWLMELGKDQSAICCDAQDLDSLDKRFRVGVLSERIWAMTPYHRKGEDFRYGFYDRAMMQGSVKVVKESQIQWMYEYYDTLAKSTRPVIAHR